MNYLDRAYRLAFKAMDGGAVQKSLGHLEWNIAGRCESPSVVEYNGRASPAHGQKNILVDVAGVNGRRTPMSISVALSVPCRQCKHCLKRRALMWRQRTSFEILKNERTWFGTLTLSPQGHFEDVTHARIRGTSRGVDFDLSNDDEKYAARVRIFHMRVVKFFKRVRKNTRANIRYVCVYERHRSGDPHCHLFIHERTDADTVTKRILEAEWHGGFSHWRLVDKQSQQTTRYITKYLTKDARIRIRNSIAYGQCIDTGVTQAYINPHQTISDERTFKGDKVREGHDPPSDLL